MSVAPNSAPMSIPSSVDIRNNLYLPN
jgi:hypothetical protein